jgi:hypothetical protein
LRSSLTGLPLNRTVDEAVAHLMGGFDELGVYSDVPAGLAALAALDGIAASVGKPSWLRWSADH